MTDKNKIETTNGKFLAVLPIHFDLPYHQLLIGHFNDAVVAVQRTVAAIDKQLFNDKINYEIYIIPPENGGFLAKIGIAAGVMATTAVGASWAFLESEDIGQPFIERYTGQTVTQWAEAAADALKDSQKPLSSANVQEVAASMLMAEAAKNFLKLPATELQSLHIDNKIFASAISAKNKFYETCINNPDLRGIGFDPTYSFSIPREQFEKRITPIYEVVVQPVLPPIWHIGTADITASSPNWERKGRDWKGKDKNGDVSYQIDDDKFWHLVETQELKIKITDSLHVQWAYRDEGKRTKRVLRVLKFNNTKISNPMTDEEIKEYLNSDTLKKIEKEPDLFSIKSEE